ncbi:aldose 1-epimerase family protein [Cellulomonas wangsupingiae]|uniref:Aldose 1-epimerase family protein n=1 Tax=Cellulomonas wangsupingiae TaxID=2968085 RepID=A0ABY5KBG6_9CELL|nr:aldose 1-epimerase family protein [Cellulomonas wangsupingiae]MCC2334738.1 aldose 1-epimerase family protein [Cellulomonas wangsupingiae]UUI66306.1 aldose 1-epimerase family protein [Cellulomonas wangsupingiae]
MNTPPPTGDQHVLRHGEQVAVVTSVAASLREYRVGDRDVVLPFAVDSIAPAFSGAVLAPWPNRLRDATYRFRGVTYEVPLTEHARLTALHGLVAYERFTPVAVAEDTVTLRHDLVPTPGYPWPLRLDVTYRLGDEGLTVSVAATNQGADVAPYGVGFHPWLSPGPGPVDACTVQLDAARRVTVDDRLLPVGTQAVSGDFDLRAGRPLEGVALDDAWVDVTPDAEGLTWATLTGADGRTVAVWADATLPAWQVCTGDGIPGIERRGVAIEPMTCVADAFRTGELLVELDPGATHEVRWGLSLR